MSSWQHRNGSRNGRSRRIGQLAAAVVTILGLSVGTTIVGAAVAGGAGAAVRPAQSGPSCTFTVGSQSGSGSLTNPTPLTGLSSGDVVNTSCTGLDPSSIYGVFQASPLAVVTQPFNLSVLGSEADIEAGIGTLVSPNASGDYNQTSTLGTTGAGTFSSGGNISPTSMFAPDPNAQCPPSQAEVNAGLGTCVLAVADITATTAPNAAPSQSDFVGEALLDFAGQPVPQVPPTVNFNPPVVAPGHNATVTDAGSSTNWWGAGWWGGGYANNSLTASPYAIPAANVLVNGAPASSASVQVNPAVYCFYGGASATSCNGGTADTPGAGVIFPSELAGTVAIPASVQGASATVSIYEPNVWGSVFPGNNTNTAFPANDLTGSGGVGITHIGYWEVASDGGIFSFGTANFFGSMGGQHLNEPIVGMAATPDGGGYWEVASDGGLFAFGDANFFGSMGGQPLNEPIVGIAATPDGGGYWEVASDGGLFAFGDANFYGSMGGQPLNKPIVGIATTADGGGYWEVASDGGIFAFGDANFYGSMGGQPLNEPIVGIAGTPDGGGYWEVASDGGLFAFGDANFFGSMGGQPLNKPIVGMWSTANGQGYWESASDGGIFSFGNAVFLGSTGGMTLNAPVVGGSITPTLPSASITLTKSTTSTGYGAAGQKIPYNYLVVNSGNANLTNVSVSDNKTSVSCPSTVLSKGASETCTGSYTVNQADVDNGSVTNTATASANGSEGIGVSSSPAIVTVLASSAISSMRIHETTTSRGYGAAGQTVDFGYTVTNTGTTTLHGITVADSVTNAVPDAAVPVTVTCPSGNVAPGQSVVCAGTYTTVQDDVDSGSISTSSTASAVNSAGAAVHSIATGPASSVTVEAAFATASLTVTTTPSPGTYSNPAGGDVISYSYVIQNTGTLSLTEISLTDSVQETNAPIDVTCPGLTPLTVLAPGAVYDCTGAYTTTTQDVTNGTITDVALATGFDVFNFNQWTAYATGDVTYSP